MQIRLGMLQIVFLSVQLGKALIHLRIFLDGSHVDGAHLADAVANPPCFSIGNAFVKLAGQILSAGALLLDGLQCLHSPGMAQLIGVPQAVAKLRCLRTNPS